MIKKNSVTLLSLPNARKCNNGPDVAGLEFGVNLRKSDPQNAVRMCEILMRRIHASDSTHMCACVKFLTQVMECLEKVMDIQAEKAFLKASPEAQRKWLLLQDGYAPHVFFFYA